MIMKTKHYILFALTAFGLTTSCHDGDWDAPALETAMESYGNKYIQETNLKTIDELKTIYKNEISNNSLKQVKEPLQIKGIVTGNDEGGNIYNALYIQDNTGAIAISVGQGGLAGPFSVGQSVLIELQGLYVGGYGKQQQIGTTYTNPNKDDAKPQVGRMTRFEWQEHYKLISPIEGLEAKPLEKNWSLTSLSMPSNCGRLITLKGVEIKDADGTTVFAPKDNSVALTANCANRPIKNHSNVVLRTSTYADFANRVMPTGRVDITGILTRFDNTWQILMRTDADIQESAIGPAPALEPSGKGTKSDPYNVAGLFEATKDLKNKEITSELYVKGYVAQRLTYNSQYGSIDYMISDDKEGISNSFYVYSGIGVGKEKFTSADDLKLGDEIVICGKVTNYNYILEFEKQSYIVSLNEAGNDIPAIGSGTLDDPYNVSAVINYTESLGADVQSDKEVYFKGYAVEITDISAQYGNATFIMSDKKEGNANRFTVYRAAGLGNQKVTDPDFIKKGDEVVICGKVVYFKGKTPETVQGAAYVYSVNGQTK